MDAKTAQSLGHERAFKIVDACAEHAPPEHTTTTTFRAMQSAGGAKALEGFAGGPVPSSKTRTLGKNARLRVDAQKRLESPGGARGKTRAALQDLDEDRAEGEGAAREARGGRLPRPAQIREALAAVLPEGRSAEASSIDRDGLSAALRGRRTTMPRRPGTRAAAAMRAPALGAKGLPARGLRAGERRRVPPGYRTQKNR